jgi:hypothetical protein
MKIKGMRWHAIRLGDNARFKLDQSMVFIVSMSHPVLPAKRLTASIIFRIPKQIGGAF